MILILRILLQILKKNSTNIPLLLGYLSYNFCNWCKTGPLTCSLSVVFNCNREEKMITIINGKLYEKRTKRLNLTARFLIKSQGQEKRHFKRIEKIIRQ